MGQRTVLRHLNRLGAFGASVAITTVVGVLSIPVVIAHAGSATWGIIALGQSTALLFGVLVSFGWGTIGPAMVAGMPAEDRPRMYLDSLVSRSYLFVLAAPLAILSVWVIAGESAPIAIIACIAYLLPFLGASWFFVGDARPGRLLVFDTLPVTLGTVFGLIGLVGTDNVYVFLLIQLGMNALAVVSSGWLIRKDPAAGGPRFDFNLSRALKRLKGQRHGVVTAATSSLYVNTPVLVVGAFLPGALALYAMAEKFFKYGLTAVGPVVQVLQGSIADPDRNRQDARVRTAAKLAPFVAALGALAMAVCIPWASRLLSQGEIEVGFELSIPMGVVFGAVAVSQVVGLACLIPIGEGKALAVSTVFGAAVGIPLIITGALTMGVSAVAWAVAASELAVAIYQLKIVFRYFRRTARDSAGAVAHSEG